MIALKRSNGSKPSSTTARTALRLGVLLSCVRAMLAQHTEATCNVTSLSWSFNSLNQSPCLIAAFIANPCSTSNDYDVPAIGPGFHYNPSSQPSLCECSTVTYSLYSACASCQGATIGPWETYAQNCTKSSPDGEYAFQIPPNTAVPAWAYQLVTASNRFNLTLAQSVGDKPENVTSNTPATTSASRVSSVTGAGALSPSSTDDSNSNPNPTQSDTGKNSSGSNVGAIVGGVVGGVGGIALIGAALIFFLLRRRRNASNLPSSGGDSGGYDENRYMAQHFPNDGTARPMSIVPAGSTSPAPELSSTYAGTAYQLVGDGDDDHRYMNQHLPSGGAATMSVTSSSPPPSTQPGYHPVPVTNRLYDPEDPSTFPPTPAPGTWSNNDPTLVAHQQPLTSKYAYDKEPRAEV